MDLELWKKRKKELHLNYEKLAEKSGVSKRTIEDIFRGFTTTPRIDTVESIERALELDRYEKTPTLVRSAETEIAENFIREYSEQMKEKAFQDIAKLYKAIKDASLKAQILVVLVTYLNRNGINTENIVGY